MRKVKMNHCLPFQLMIIASLLTQGASSNSATGTGVGNFSDASIKCRRKGGYLEGNLQKIDSVLRNIETRSIWTNRVRAKFKGLQNVEQPYDHSQIARFDNNEIGMCSSVNLQNMLMKNNTCNSRLNHICEMHQCSTCPRSLHTGQCIKDIVGGNCFFIFNKALPWQEARKNCIKHGLDLAIPASNGFLPPELQGAYTALYQHQQKVPYWLGIRDSDWVTTNPAVNKDMIWYENLPMHEGNGKNCEVRVRLSADRVQSQLVACHFPYTYLCSNSILPEHISTKPTTGYPTCPCMLTGEGKILRLSCTTRKAFICESDQVNCEHGSNLPENTYCYQTTDKIFLAITVEKNWTEAQRWCAQLDAQLANVHHFYPRDKLGLITWASNKLGGRTRQFWVQMSSVMTGTTFASKSSRQSRLPKKTTLVATSSSLSILPTVKDTATKDLNLDITQVAIVNTAASHINLVLILISIVLGIAIVVMSIFVCLCHKQRRIDCVHKSQHNERDPTLPMLQTKEDNEGEGSNKHDVESQQIRADCVPKSQHNERETTSLMLQTTVDNEEGMGSNMNDAESQQRRIDCVHESQHNERETMSSKLQTMVDNEEGEGSNMNDAESQRDLEAYGYTNPAFSEDEDDAEVNMEKHQTGVLVSVVEGQRHIMDDNIFSKEGQRFVQALADKVKYSGELHDETAALGQKIIKSYVEIAKDKDDGAAKGVRWSCQIIAFFLEMIQEDLRKGNQQSQAQIFVKSICREILIYLETAKEDMKKRDEQIGFHFLIKGTLWQLVELPLNYLGKEEDAKVYNQKLEYLHSTSICREVNTAILEYAVQDLRNRADPDLSQQENKPYKSTVSSDRLQEMFKEYQNAISTYIRESIKGKLDRKEMRAVAQKVQNASVNIAIWWVDSARGLLLKTGIPSLLPHLEEYGKKVVDELQNLEMEGTTQEQILLDVGNLSLRTLNSYINDVISSLGYGQMESNTEPAWIKKKQNEEEHWKSCREAFNIIYGEIESLVNFMAENCDKESSLASTASFRDDRNTNLKKILQQCEENIDLNNNVSRVITITGSVSSGKSSLINALLREDVLPVGVGRTTTGMIRISALDQEECDANAASSGASPPMILKLLNLQKDQEGYLNHPQNIESLREILEKHAAPDPEEGLCSLLPSGVASLRDKANLLIQLPEHKFPILSGNTIIVDSPGYGYSNDYNSLVINEGRISEIVLLVADVEREVSIDDIEHIQTMSDRIGSTHVMLCNNKWDKLSERPKESERIFSRSKRQIWKMYGRYVPKPERFIFCLSSSKALEDNVPGKETYQSEFHRLAKVLKSCFTENQVEKQSMVIDQLLGNILQQTETEKPIWKKYFARIKECLEDLEKQEKKLVWKDAEKKLRVQLEACGAWAMKKLIETDYKDKESVQTVLNNFKNHTVETLGKLLEDVLKSTIKDDRKVIQSHFQNYQEMTPKSTYNMSDISLDVYLNTVITAKCLSQAETIKVEERENEQRQRIMRDLIDKEEKANEERMKGNLEELKKLKEGWDKLSEGVDRGRARHDYLKKVLLTSAATGLTAAWVGLAPISIPSTGLLATAAAATEWVSFAGITGELATAAGLIFNKQLVEKDMEEADTIQGQIEAKTGWQPDKSKEMELQQKTKTTQNVMETQRKYNLRKDSEEDFQKLSKSLEDFYKDFLLEVQRLEMMNRREMCQIAKEKAEEEERELERKYKHVGDEVARIRAKIPKCKDLSLISDVMSFKTMQELRNDGGQMPSTALMHLQI